MKKLLSFLALLLLFATSGHAEDLTTALWQGGGTCEYNVGSQYYVGTIYGLGSPEIDKYADLSGYSKLILTVTAGSARAFFNATSDQEADRITVGNSDNYNGKKYLTVTGNTYTIDLNAIWFDYGKAYLNSIKSGGWNANATITSMELVPYEGTPVKWNVDNGISINTNDGLRDKFNNDDPIIVPIRNSSGQEWSVNPRLKVKNADTEAVLQVGDLCGNDPVGNYFKVIYSVDGILQNTTFGTAGANNNTETYPQIKGLTAKKWGEVSMTVMYKGNGTYKPYSKTYNFNVERLACHFDEYNPNWNPSYQKYMDDGAYRDFWRLRRNSDNAAINFDTSKLCTVVTLDEMGEPVQSTVITLGNYGYFTENNTKDRLDINITPNSLGVATVRIEYPGDDIYSPTTHIYDITVKQHFVTLKWVDSNGNETNEWVTNQGNMWNNIPRLKIYVDNEEKNVSDFMDKLTFTSNNIKVATINDNNIGQVTTANGHYVDFQRAGVTVITVQFASNFKQVNNINHYYYNSAGASYTMKLEGTAGSGDQPHIIWVTAAKDWGNFGYGNNGRGSYLGQRYVQEKDAAKRAEYPFQGNIAPYGPDQYVSAIALKKTVTDAMLATKRIFKIYGYADHYYYMDDENNTIDNAGGWRVSKPNCIPVEWRFDESDEYFTKVNYIVDKPERVRDASKIVGNGNNNQTRFKFVPRYPSQDSLQIYAYLDDYSTISVTKLLVNPGELHMRFVPDYGEVNVNRTISPYVNIPDLRLEDVNKIWLTCECEDEGVIEIPNNGAVYEAGKTSAANIAKYLYTVTANDTIWKNSSDHSSGWVEIRPTTWLRGVNPEIMGKIAGKNCVATLHLTSDMYNEATADYTVRVVAEGDKPMFHWLVNDKVVNGQHVIDESMKTIVIAEGDFIYMPGIVGNSNGNNEFSKANQNKYMYGMKDGVITMSYAKYFPGEGVPNYYLTTTVGGNPSVPLSGANQAESQAAIITWSHGLGSNWRKDSLMIYGNKPGTMYLYAQDPQTHKSCTPIQIKVISRQTMVDEKQEVLGKMTYPFTWDFENMDMTKYEADVETNGGTYWQKKFVEPDKADYDQGFRRYNRNYSVEKPLYQYNGGMNADWDDKDGNRTTRQRWFKDIYTYTKKEVDGQQVDALEYAPEFKGIMLNLSGLDYWEQKYQRFSIDREGHFIYFEGGPIFIQLPGFGLAENKTGKTKKELEGSTENPGTRSFDNYIGGEHNHINTAKYNVNEGYTQLLSVNNKNNVDIQYPVQKTNASGQQREYRNNMVRFVIKAKGGRDRDKYYSTDEHPNENSSSQFHIGGASMINEALDENDINWTQGVHNGYSWYNLDDKEAKVYIVELDPYDPELQDHIYLMFNNDVYVYWMAITNEPRNILSDFDGVTYAYPKDIDMEKTNLTLGMQTKEGIYTKADASGKHLVTSDPNAEYTIKNVYQVGSNEPGQGTEVQLEAYIVNNFNPEAQDVQLTPISGNIPKNEGVMLYTTPRMSELAENPVGLEPAWYNRGNTAYSVWNESKGEYEWFTALASDSTNNGNIYNNSHNYYYLPLYFIAQAENMSEANYVAPSTTGGTEIPDISPDGHVTTTNLLRAVTYGKTLDMDYDQSGNQLINFGYNNEFICRRLVYTDEGVQTKEMNKDDLYVDNTTQVENTHEDIYYYAIGIDYARFYRINTKSLNHHNRSAYLSLTWDEYIVNTVGKKIIPSSSNSNEAAPSHLRFKPTNNPIDIRFIGSETQGDLVSEDGGFPDGIKEVEQTANDGVFYNLNGIRVNTPSKGVYIINGKKVVVK